MCANFWAKRTTLTSLGQICPKIDLGLETQKTNVGIRINVLETSCAPIFRQNGQLWLFRSKFAQKLILGLEFQKSKWRFKISISRRLCVPIFSQKITLNFLAYIWGHCPITCNILVLITLRVLQRAEWRLKWARWRWVHGLLIHRNLQILKSVTSS